MSIASSHPEAAERGEEPKTVRTFVCDEKFRAEFKEWVKAEDLSYSDVQRECGVNSAIVSQYLNEAGNVYPSPIGNIENRLRNLMVSYRVTHLERVTTIEHDVTDFMADLVKETVKFRTIGLGIGEPGVGKTRSLPVITKLFPLAIVLTVYVQRNNKDAIAKEIYKGANIGRIERGTDVLAGLFKGAPKGERPIVLDDAHSLTPSAAQMLADLNDRTQWPIIMLGDHRLERIFLRDARRLRRCGAMEHFRLGDEAGLANPLPVVKHLIKETLPDEGADEFSDLVKLGKEAVQQAGAFGVWHKDLQKAAFLRLSDKDSTWCDLVREAHNVRLLREKPI